MNKDFDNWNEVKKQIAMNGEPNLFPQEGEVWMCAIGKNIGYEQDGGGTRFSRPALVIKKFNNKMFWVAPLSTKQKKFDFYHNFVDPNGQKVSVILAQLRLISVKRFERKMYFLSTEELDKIKNWLKDNVS